MSGRETPDRGDSRPATPLIPARVWWAAGAAAFVVWTVLVGGVIAGVVTGAGPAHPSAGLYAPGGFADVIRSLLTRPGAAASAWPEGSRPAHDWGVWFGLVAAAAVFAVPVVLLWHRLGRRDRDALRRRAGLADRAELSSRKLDASSAVAAARKDRPSIAEDKKAAAHEVTRRLGRLYGETGKDADVFVQYRDPILVEGPTGSGKTWRVMWPAVMSAVGFVASTSTKPDVLWSTVGSRLRRGPVRVFDPEGMSRWPFPMRWSIIAGCDDPDVALRRAQAMAAVTPMEGVTNASYFQTQAATLLRCYLFAAAVDGRSWTTVRRWTTRRQVPDVTRILADRLPEWELEYTQLTSSRSDSADDVVSTIQQMLSPLASPKMLAAVDVPVGESEDLETLIRANATIYLLSKGGTGSLSMFTAVLASELHYTLEQMALRTTNERLDPPASLVLDEVNNIAPIPDLPDKVTDSGGRGIAMTSGVHSENQNVTRWGADRGRRFTTEHPVRLILPGLADRVELDDISGLCGTREEWFSPDHAPQIRPVMSGDEIRRMRPDQGLMISRGARPALLHLPTLWDVPASRELADSSREIYDWIATEQVLPSWAWERKNTPGAPQYAKDKEPA